MEEVRSSGRPGVPVGLHGETIFNLRGTAAFRRQGDRSGLTRAQHPSEAQSNKLCDPSMGEQNLLSKAASFRGQWFTYNLDVDGCTALPCTVCQSHSPAQIVY